MQATMETLPQGRPVAPKAESAVPAGAAPAAGKDQKALEIYRKLGLAAMKIIFDKATSAQLVEMMRGAADSPAQAVASAASTVLGQMQERVNGIDPKLVYTVTPPVVIFLLELAQAAGLFKPTPQMAQEAIALVGREVGQAPAAAPAGPTTAPGLIGSQMTPQPGGV